MTSGINVRALITRSVGAPKESFAVLFKGTLIVPVLVASESSIMVGAVSLTTGVCYSEPTTYVLSYSSSILGFRYPCVFVWSHGDSLVSVSGKMRHNGVPRKFL